MNKSDYLVQIFFPMVNQHFDVYIPKTIMVHQTIELLINLFHSKFENNFTGEKTMAVDNMVLCDLSTGKILDVNVSNERAGITNGSELMLI